jgi:two-component system sensor histidine kinase/response regulator
MNRITKYLLGWERKIRKIGYYPGLCGHEKRKLGIFNLLNAIFGATLGIIIPLVALSGGVRLNAGRWCLVSAGPLLITGVVMLENRLRRYSLARMTFFILHPSTLAACCLLGIDLGTDLFFVCYGVLCVSFLYRLPLMIVTFSFCLTCYFLSIGMAGSSPRSFEISHLDTCLFNRMMALFFIFYGIFLVRKENNRYQLLLVDRNRALQSRNRRIELQKKESVERALLMQQQALQLSELNSLKNKLFSLVTHDLRGPLHAMHRLFKGIVDFDLPPAEIKQMMPDVARSLGETTGQIENLLQWAKSQMQAESIHPQVLEISKLINEILNFLRLQVENKRLHVETSLESPLYVYADKETIKLVLRNLVSNAIKFTPEAGIIKLGATERSTHVEVFVQDSGAGIPPEDLSKLEQNVQYTTTGTANESGTGLGLMLCREFLSRNGSRLLVESEPGRGSIFSFTLPKVNDLLQIF